MSLPTVFSRCFVFVEKAKGFERETDTPPGTAAIADADSAHSVSRESSAFRSAMFQLIPLMAIVSLAVPRAPRQHTPIAPDSVAVVHLVQSNHLDIGFSDYVSKVLNRYTTGGWGTAQPPAPREQPVYYDSFLLAAANTSRILRAKHPSAPSAPRFVYNTHPWIAKLFLECDAASFPYVGPGAPGDGGVGHVDKLRCPTAAEVASWTAALRRGDAAVQAFAHSAQPEAMDAGTFGAALRIGAALADKYGLPGGRPRVMSQRDVPGLTRGAVPLLAAHGVRGISVGANDGSPPPIVPSTADCYGGWQQVRTPFVWRDAASNTSVLMDVHPGGYVRSLATD